ncbi:hypothetical protein Q765_15855 [Flavobacterium rivuli WB 3.3-2 = DSM 21788]|uniref:Cytochrome c domain-containing protein n=1 Tax=Flavobacterium rivuli WB 3.3-2 = DSM 21788 TaxID=1121895 RepID=A0A0A2LZN5_9FLAO|nr:cytochrome c peroxidase [Flavobacterium rivuli]KGO85499.1 hypothetical protein Q765_15855 [Flavobacterium rivuli WB 3.3-2 = DSM 21788]
MNLKYILPLFAAITLFFAPNFFSVSKSEYYQNDYGPVIQAALKNFKQEVDVLNTVAVAYANGQADSKQLQQQLAKTRNAYKANEALLEYYYPKHIKAYINGPPLNHLDPYPVKEEYKEKGYYVVSAKEYSNSLPLDYIDLTHYRGDRRVVGPVGLQRLDELIFSDEAALSKKEIQQLAAQVKEALPALEMAIAKRTFFYDFEIMEASRLELIRIFSMGITGFDTPGSLNATDEAASSLKGIQQLLQPLLQKADLDKQSAIKTTFAGAISYLHKNSNFEKFDRLTFLTDYINPLYRQLYEVQVVLKLETSAKKWDNVESWNSASTNIFAADFLNPYYYSLLKEDADNPELRELGKKLFYDKSLSSTGQMNCASCHKPELAFTDGQKTSAASSVGKYVLRNSPTLINAVFSDRYFYDLRAADLEEQAEHVIENHLEFNTSFIKLVAGLNANDNYKKQFALVFKDNKEISRYRYSSALASYIISLRSFNSSFDRYVQGKSKKIDPQVKLGFNLFTGKANCATCHYVPTFSGLVPPMYQENETEVLGVPTGPNLLEMDTDYGRITNNIPDDSEEIYRNSFKTMTVRNARLTAPYFHNGSFKTLEEVIDFYNKGGAAGMGMGYEVPNQTLSPDPLNLSKKEVAALIAFIESLTDNPFKD